MLRSFRMAALALVLGGLTFGAVGQASAHPIYVGFGWHHGWGGWGWGWGPRRIVLAPGYGGCYTQRWVGPWGRLHWRRVCD